MNDRERYIATMKFQTPDKIPFSPGGPREKTIKRWVSEGLDPSRPWFGQLLEELEIVMPEKKSMPNLDVSFKMMPAFEEKVLSHENGHYIVSDWMGAITEISDEYDYTYIRSARDFVTRKWHKFPVESRADFEEMKKRFKVDTIGRFPEDFKQRCELLKDRESVLMIAANGPFWQLREWCGFEGLCMMLIEDPEFVRDMMLFWKSFVTDVMTRIFENTSVDRVLINEDMAYKAHSMISPAMTREFLQPCYDEWVPLAKSADVSVMEMDSDGCIDELIPIWIESGFDACSPIEVAAHNDIVEFRQLFKRDIAYSGGIDKRCIAKGGNSIIDELNRVSGVIADGGYHPGCDHGVPHDISWQNFIDYSRMLAKLTGWL